MNPTSYPLFIKDKNFKDPNLPFYYLLSSEGLFLAKNFPIYRAVIPITKAEKKLTGLQNQSEELQLKIPCVPCSLIEKIAGFFYVVFRLYHSEAIVLLYFNQEKQSFRISVPKQEIYPGNSADPVYMLDYIPEPTPHGYTRVGTIHSHAKLPAFYSIIDENDSRFDDSLNIVIGNVDSMMPSFSACFMVNGFKFNIELKDILKGFCQRILPVPSQWINQISIK